MALVDFPSFIRLAESYSDSESHLEGGCDAQMNVLFLSHCKYLLGDWRKCDATKSTTVLGLCVTATCGYMFGYWLQCRFLQTVCLWLARLPCHGAVKSVG